MFVRERTSAVVCGIWGMKKEGESETLIFACQPPFDRNFSLAPQYERLEFTWESRAELWGLRQNSNKKKRNEFLTPTFSY